MKANCFYRRINAIVLVLIKIGLMVGMLISCQSWAFSKDELREDITYEEAQSLVSFSICIPNYIPPGVDPNPQIIFDSHDVDVPEETYIRLRYKSLEDQDRVFEVYQRYTPDARMKSTYPESAHEGAKITLLYWILFPDAVERAKMEASVFQTDQIVWWLYEIVDPKEYRSTMTTWVKDHVEYRIPSYLPSKEIEKITLSMFECSSH